MKILYVGPFRLPDGDAAAPRVLNNARILKNLGHSVTFFSFGGKYCDSDKTSEGYFRDGMRYVITNDIDSHTWKERFLRYIYPYLNAWKLIKEYIAAFDVIITYNPPFLFNRRMISICTKYDKKMILDITEWPESNETPGGKWLPFYWMSQLNMTRTNKRICNKIVISSFLNRYYSSGNNICLPPLVNLKEEKWNKMTEIDNRRIKAHKGIRILFAGTPAKKDLLANLIKALLLILRDNNRIQLIVAGVDEKNAFKYLDDASQLSFFSENIVFLGRVPQDAIPSYYKICDFSAIIREPSRKNTAGFPTKMAESMAAGCPVLMTNTSDLAMIADDGENSIIIANASPESIAEGLNRILLLTDKQILNMKDKAFMTGKRFFDYSNYIESMHKFITSLR